mmetsp:Transcript_9745/g.19864  ORF Transcript_9745/g.19864 Transcript_9745/m.19864 type:complete len:255 (-) Transcript_9745:272-1036(-)
MLTTNNEVADSKILPVDGVHDCFGRTSVIHAHIQPRKAGLAPEVLALGLPELDILVSFAQEFVINKLGIGEHTGSRGHVVTLELADQGIEEYPHLFPGFPKQLLSSVDQSVFVRTVQGVAGLEGYGDLVPLFSNEVSELNGVENTLYKVACVVEGEDGDFSTDQSGSIIADPQACAWVIRSFGSINSLDERRLIPVIDGLYLESSENIAGGCATECDGTAYHCGLGFIGGDRQNDWNCPSPLVSIAFDAFCGED